MEDISEVDTFHGNGSYVSSEANVYSIANISLLIITTVLGLVGNASLVVFIVFKMPTRKTTTHIFIWNMALTDFIANVIAVPNAVASVRTSLLDDHFCKALNYLYLVVAYTEVYTVVLLCVDRFLVIVLPTQSKKILTVRNGYIAIFVLWVLILASCTPVINLYQVFNSSSDTNNNFCHFNSAELDDIEKFHMFIMLTQCAIPFGIGCLFFSPVVIKSCFGVHPPGAENEVEDQKGITRLVGIMAILFSTIWITYHTVIYIYFVHGMDIPYMVVLILTSFVYLNDFINPVLCAIFWKDFREFNTPNFCCKAPVIIETVYSEMIALTPETDNE